MMTRTTLYACVLTCFLMTGQAADASGLRTFDPLAKADDAREKINIQRHNGFNVMRKKSDNKQNGQPRNTFNVETTTGHALQTINGTSTDVKKGGFVVTPQNKLCGENCMNNNSWNVMQPTSKETRNMFQVDPMNNSFRTLGNTNGK